MHQWNEEIKKKARTLRKEGYSFGQLTKELNVSKSTLHTWISGIKRPAKFTRLDRIRWAKEIQPLGAQMQRRIREEKILRIISNVKREMSLLTINTEVKKILLAGLYWCEGSKGRGTLQFANTDPRLMLLFISVLRECFEIDESKFRIRLHLHFYHREKEIKKFWSKLLKVPLTQFTKTYRKYRSKERTFRRNFGGICFLRYYDDALKENIIQYAFALGEKIAGHVNVPVA